MPARPRIAHLAGPTATIQNSPPLVTSNKARRKYGLPLRANPDGSAARFDALRAQRLAAPAKVYVECFSAASIKSQSNTESLGQSAHQQLNVGSSQLGLVHSRQPVDFFSEGEDVLGERGMFVFRNWRAETGMEAPETRCPTFQNVICELVIQRIKLNLPDGGIRAFEEAKEYAPKKAGPAFSSGGTLSASDNRSPAPPISKVYLARRPRASGCYPTA